MMDAAGVEELSPAECLNRLRPARWGRVAASIQTIAVVVPVPVRVRFDRMLFSTLRGSTFDRAVQRTAISIQVEGHDTVAGGVDVLWSIVVSGICAPDQDGDMDGYIDGGAPRHRVNGLPFSLLQGWRAPVPPDLLSSGPPGRLPHPPPSRT